MAEGLLVLAAEAELPAKERSSIASLPPANAEKKLKPERACLAHRDSDSIRRLYGPSAGGVVSRGRCGEGLERATFHAIPRVRPSQVPALILLHPSGKAQESR
jgi:hypothetical protein